MKLNLVADYELPNGKRFAHTHTIDTSENLTTLNDKTAMWFPCVGGGGVRVAPKSIMAVPSHKRAVLVANYWNNLSEKQGKCWRGERIAAEAESEAVK